MSETLQRLIVFFIIGLPLSWGNIKKWWYLVVLWVSFLIAFNVFLLDKLMRMVENLK